MNRLNRILSTLLLLSSSVCLQGCWLLLGDADEDAQAPVSITFLNYQDSFPQYFLGQPVPVNQLRDPSGAVGANVSFGILPPLPNGMQIDRWTGAISGSPLSTLAQSEFVVSGYSGGLKHIEATLQVTVQASVAPTGLSYSVNPASYVGLTSIIDNQPSYSGGIASFSVTPALPAGLLLDLQRGTISGRPNNQDVSGTYRITGSNPFGSTFADVDISITRALTSSRLLVADSVEPLISAYLVDDFPGNLYPRGYTAIASPAIDMVGDLQGRFALVLHADGQLYSHAIQSDTPRLSNGTLQMAVLNAVKLGLDPTGTRLAVLSLSALTVFDVDSAGTLSGFQSVGIAPGSMDMVMHPTRAFAYVSNGSLSEVSVSSVDGTLQRLPGAVPVLAFGGEVSSRAEHLAISASGFHLHVADTSNGLLFTFLLSAGGTTAATHLTPFGSPVVVPGGAIEYLVASPDGRLVFASTAFNASIEAFAFAPGLGLLQHAFSTPVGSYPSQIRVNEASTELYVLDTFEKQIYIYVFSNSALFYRDRTRTRQSPEVMQVVRGSQIANQTRHVFLSNESANSVDVVSFDSTTDSLQLGTPVSALRAPQGVVFNQTHGVAYVPELGANRVSQFSLDQVNTALLPLSPPSVPLSGSPTHMLMGAAERFAYVLDSAGILGVLAVDANDGSLTNTGLQVAVSANAGPLALEPTGQFLYVVEPANARVVSFRIDFVTGLPVLTGSVPVPPNPTDLIAFPQAREMYVTSAGLGVVAALAIDESDGSLSQHGVDAAVGAAASASDIMPSGFNIFVGSASDSTISILDVDFQSGTVAPFPLGISPLAIPLGFTDLRVASSDLYVFASFGAPTSQLLLLKTRSDESLLQVDSVPIAAGVHRLEVDAPRQ